MMKADRNQLAKIHIAKKQLKLSEDSYRAALGSYNVEHSNELSSQQAEDLLNKFTTAGFRTSPSPKLTKGVNGYGKSKYSALDGRGKPFAASVKLRKIEVLWRRVSNSKTDESLQLFIKNRTGVDHITFLHDKHARIIIAALENMGCRK